MNTKELVKRLNQGEKWVLKENATMGRKYLEREEYLKALGLWHLARQHQQKYQEFEDALNEMLDLERGSHVSDSIWQDGDNLDAALAREDIRVKSS